MSINTEHPNYINFIRNEVNSLKFLKDQSFIGSSFNELSLKASNTFYNYHNIKEKNLRKISFEFQCDIDMIIEKRKRKVFLEAIVRPDFSEVSYMLAFCETEQETSCLIRKFHFDYAIPVSGTSAKPVYHLQYGGKQSPGLNNRDITVEHLHPKISSPRIIANPMNLALLLDLAFTEFESEITHGIKERDEWRDFIKKNEDIMLKPYFEGLRHFLIGEHSSTFLLRDFCYGN